MTLLLGRWTAPMLLALCAAGPAGAADGVLEVNQACALTGCFPGDTPNFPVTLTPAAPGRSVRLTGDLSVGTGALTAIDVSAPGATLDLGGFRIVGPALCSGVPVTNCSNTGPGVGVLGVSNVTVKNGVVTGMGDEGVRLGAAGRVEGLQVYANGGDGIQVGNDGIVWLNVVTGNGANGIACSDFCVVRDNTSTGNAERGADLGLLAAYGGNVFAQNGLEDVSGGRAVAGNACADGGCAPRGERRLYATPDPVPATAAPTACDPGFHFASFHEVYITSGLLYDTTRGFPNPDGVGTPSVRGWIRTGSDVPTSFMTGLANCSHWTTTSNMVFGSTLRLEAAWQSVPVASSPWSSTAVTCDVPTRVWCIED